MKKGPCPLWDAGRTWHRCRWFGLPPLTLFFGLSDYFVAFVNCFGSELVGQKLVLRKKRSSDLPKITVLLTNRKR